MDNSSEFSSEENSFNGKGVVPRPPFQLRSLPICYRWEVTRRHPYYQLWWQPARNHHHSAPLQHSTEQYLRKAAVMILSNIGVSGEPPDPAKNFEQLENEQLNSAWLSGAVHPISLRGMAGLLLATLPKETAGDLGLLFVNTSCDDREGEPTRRVKSLLDLATLDKPGLDEILDEPIVSVNPAASGRQISEAMAELLKHWKDQRTLEERRNRSDKYPEYLQVWDLREGWNNGAYHRLQEKYLEDIAKELKMSLSTVHNHYCGAFELIIGHPYSPELWYRTFGILKFSKDIGPEVGKVSRRRPSKSRSGRDVPEAVVTPTMDDDRSKGVINSSSSFSSDLDCWEIVDDIRSLLKKGRTDQQIVEELELSAVARELVADARKRFNEHL